MSGGHFEYNQNYIADIGRDVDRLIQTNGQSVFDEEHSGYSPEIIAEFKKAVIILKKAFIYAQRIDWMVCGDDGEDTFIERLNEELEKV